MTAARKRAALDKMRAVCAGKNWAIAGTFAEAPIRDTPDGRAEWRRLRERVVSGKVDVVMVPGLTALGEGVPAVLTEILWLREQRCDLYVHDAGLNTMSPTDQVLFTVAEALKTVDDASKQQQLKPRRKQSQPKQLPLMPYQVSVLRAGLKSGLSIAEIAKSLKLPVTRVRAEVKRLDA